MDELTEFIQSNPDPRELKRALAVQMVLQGYTYFAIRDVLQVSVGLISKYKQVFQEHGVAGLALQHQGSIGYLDTHERQTVIAWLKQRDYWNLSELQQHIEDTYAVEFASNQSYYELFAEAGLSWKKTQKRNPKADPEEVEKKKQEIMVWLESHRDEIATGKLVVFFQDECHLLWGDLCGYVWGKTSERIEVPMTNERQKQTYYGALNISTQELFIKDFKQGNSDSTIAFLQALIAKCPQSRIALIWDGASYHRSQAIKDYLALVNHDLDESEWKITCHRFAPNDPRQNPIEDVWLQAKRFIREFYYLCQSFSTVKWLFELIVHRRIFDFPKVFMYGIFSQMI